MFLQEMPTVLTVSRLAQPQREAPGMVTVIDRKMIEASGFTNIPDLLRLVPGFQVTYKYGWQPVVTYHGISDAFSRRLQVLVDGRSIFTPSFGQVDWQELPLAMEDIERLEVVHGPSAAAYGSNAFLATINIITLHGGDEPGTYFAVRRGNHNVAGYTLRHSGAVEDLAYRVTLVDRGERRFQVNPENAHDRYFNARFDYRLTEQDRLMAQFGLSRSEWEIGDLEDAIMDPPREADNRSHFVQLRWDRITNEGRSYSLQYTRSQKKYDNRWLIQGLTVDVGFPLTLPDFPATYDHDVVREQLEFEADLTLSEQVRAVYGGEIRHDTVQSPFFFAPGSILSEMLYRLFGSVEWRPSSEWLLNAGGMVEDHYFAGTTFSPRLSVHYLPSQNHAFRLGASRGYRSQTFLEQVADNYLIVPTGLTGPFPPTLLEQIIVPAPGLKPERIDSTELGYVGIYPEVGLSMNARLFYDRLDSLIDGSEVDVPGDLRDGTATQYANLVDMEMWGGEYQLQWRPEASTRIVFGQAWIWQDASARVGSAIGDAREYEISAPRLSLSLLASKDFGDGLSASIGYYQMGPVTWLSDGDPLDGYHRVDARLAKTWRSGSDSYELALTLQNLTSPYQDFEEGAAHTFDEDRVFVTFRLWH